MIADVAGDAAPRIKIPYHAAVAMGYLFRAGRFITQGRQSSASECG